jgi:uncharacterized phage protein (TIGR02220 family)
VKYRKIDTRMWGDERFRRFTDDGKLGFIFLLTHPALTSLGAMRGTMTGLAAELGWPPRRLRTALAPAINYKMVEVNEAAAYIGLPNFLKFNKPESPNVARAWVVALDLIPECTEKRALIVRCRAALTGPHLQAFEEAFAEAFGKGFSQAFEEALRHPLPNPEPEQEPSPEPLSPLTPQGEDAAIAWLDCLNREAGRHFKATPPHLKPIKARIAEGYSLEQAERVVKHKIAAWHGTEQEQYLRPETLFGTKFGGYVEAAATTNGHHAPKRSGIVASWEGQPGGEVRL